MSPRRYIIAIWLCFTIRLIFYCAMLPIWEGYDEWAHFAVVRRMAFHGEWLVAREHRLPSDVLSSLSAGPIPWTLRGITPGALTEEEYWRLTPQARAARAIPSGEQTTEATTGPNIYEALQPPLYYWIMSGPMRLLRGASLAGQIYVLRILSVLIASLALPLIFALTRSLGAAAIVSLMPGLAIDLARVGNECLGVLLFTLLTLLAMKEGGRKHAIAIGTVLGLGLLTKAYFLTAIPALLILLLARRRPRFLNAAVVCGMAFALSGWWYVRNELTTGTLSGLNESVMLRNASLPEMVHRALDLNWIRAVDSILFTHIYSGGWSFLNVRAWIYHVFYLGIALAAIGLFLVKDKGAIRTPAVIYGLFWIGQLYNVLLLYASKGLEGSMGWYMYAVIAAEVALTMAGLYAIVPVKFARAVPIACAALFALLDLYTVHAVAIPYFSGLTFHRADGGLSQFHFSMLPELWRARIFTPPLLFLWILYLAATVALVFLAACGFRASHSPEIDKPAHSRPQTQPEKT